MPTTPTDSARWATNALGAAVLAVAGVAAPGRAVAGETAPTCVRAGQCFVTTNCWTEFAGTGYYYTATSGGQLFGIARNRVTYCRMVSSAHRNGGRVRYAEVDCLRDLREGNPFTVLSFPDNAIVAATCGNRAILRSRLTLTIDGRRYSGALATAVARPCSDV